MKRVRKLVLTATALIALAVGGAAFAQAQNASTVVKPTVQHSQAGSTTPGDTDNVQSGDQSGPDQGGQAGEQNDSPSAQNESASEQNDGPESASEQNDGPDGPNDQADGPEAGQESQVN
jgi:hypothetical protein